MLTSWVIKVKKALASRYLFDNWYSLLIKYTLARIGFNVKLRARIGDCTIELDPEVFARFVSRFSHRFLIRSVKCIDGRLFINDVEVNDISDVIYSLETFAKVLGWNYIIPLHCWIKDGVKFRHIHWPILEVFDFSEYDALNVRDRVVVDVGSFICDSPIYFALKGAKRVIAIEPCSGAYAEMFENVRLNNLENVIVPVNAYLVSEQGKAHLEDDEIKDSMTTHQNYDDRALVVTLNDIISKYGIDGDAALKMDCEGCEYDIILNDYAHVKLFDEIILEYHSNVGGKPSKLLKVLSCDYRCKIVEKLGRNFGIIHCVRK